jgi:hypothetical protein
MFWRNPTSDRVTTSDVNLPDVHVFPGPAKIKVGSRPTTFFYYPVEGAPTYIERKTTLSPRGHQIGLRIAEKPDTNPGPGTYSPNFSETPKLARISRSPERDWYKDHTKDVPGPGAYNLRKRINVPKWFQSRRVTRVDDDD